MGGRKPTVGDRIACRRVRGHEWVMAEVVATSGDVRLLGWRGSWPAGVDDVICKLRSTLEVSGESLLFLWALYGSEPWVFLDASDFLDFVPCA